MAKAKTKSKKKTAAKKTTRKSSSASSSALASSLAKSKKSSVGSSTKTEVTPEMSFTQLALMYMLMLGVNSLVIAIANMLYPELVVLGTHMISPFQGLMQSMAVFSLVVVGAVPVIESVADSMKLKLGFGHWMVLYALINAATLWGVARFAEMLGLGIASWQVVVALAIALDIAQGAAMKFTQPQSK